MPVLDWIGKNKVINHHLDVPYRVLERKYSYDENGQHTEDNGSENMIIHGDNLEALKYDGKAYLRKHHLYVCPEDSAELKRHIAFRDYLRSHSDAVREYSRIKEEGARLYPYDIDRYNEHKTPFIEKIYKEIGLLQIRVCRGLYL